MKLSSLKCHCPGCILGALERRRSRDTPPCSVAKYRAGAACGSFLTPRAMSTSREPRIDAYIADAAPFAQPILKHLRELVHKGCPDVVETMKWSMPYFEHAGALMCSMAAFKAHAVFGFWHQGMEKLVGKLGESGAMGSFGRITSLADLPPDKKMIELVREAAKLNESGAPGRPRPAAGAPSKELLVPDDLAAALKRNKTAAKTFENFRPSHRKEYIEWIVEAKREETRQKRIEMTISQLEEGKSRHWKYQNC